METQIAHCATLPITAPAKEFRLIPAGTFRAIDGRPYGLDGWHLYRDAALRIIRMAADRASDYVIDYEHQTLSVAKNGQAAPAAGWFKRLEWREGDGLFVTDARWTERAKAMIQVKEYRFISPVFTYDITGRVLDVLHAALTNNPALDGLTELAATRRLFNVTPTTPELIAKAACAYQDSMNAQGVHVTTVQAVLHVSPVSAALSAASRRPHCAHRPESEAIAKAACSYQDSMRAKGIHVTTVQAVNHVSPTATTHYERNSREI